MGLIKWVFRPPPSLCSNGIFQSIASKWAENSVFPNWVGFAELSGFDSDLVGKNCFGRVDIIGAGLVPYWNTFWPCDRGRQVKQCLPCCHEMYSLMSFMSSCLHSAHDIELFMWHTFVQSSQNCKEIVIIYEYFFNIHCPQSIVCKMHFVFCRVVTCISDRL